MPAFFEGERKMIKCGRLPICILKRKIVYFNRGYSAGIRSVKKIKEKLQQEEIIFPEERGRESKLPEYCIGTHRLFSSTDLQRCINCQMEY